MILKEAFLLIAKTAYNLALFYEACWGGWAAGAEIAGVLEL